MKKKTIIILTVLIVTLLIISTVYAARTKPEPASTKKGGIKGFFDSIFCLFKCGWPAWILLLLPPIAVWFWCRILHVF